jgi:uncharacterized protein GlcG (DUF336 family)
MKQTHTVLAGLAAMLVSTSSVLAAGVALPGDTGRPNDGVPPTESTPRPPNPNPPKLPRAPATALALEAAQAIAEGCKQFHLGVAVVNSVGAPILVYIPDGSQTRHSFFAIRKAYSAVIFKVPTSEIAEQAQHPDSDVAARIKTDPNLVGYPGGLPLKVGNEVIGAIGISGADPNPHNEECGQIGVKKIEARLK